MRNSEMAADYIKRSDRCLEEAKLAFDQGDYAGVVRRSQEALELALEALLRWSGI